MNDTNPSSARYTTLSVFSHSNNFFFTQPAFTSSNFFSLLNVLFSIKVPENGIPPEWYSYFLCGVKGISDELSPNGLRCGMFVAVSGNVPPAAGLSSSSALVSAATLATSYINDVC